MRKSKFDLMNLRGNVKSTLSIPVLLSLISIVIVSVFHTSEASGLGGCPTVQVMSAHMNEMSAEKCGPGKIEWDLSNFVPDGTVCESRQQGLNLVSRVVEGLCEEKIEGDDITTKLQRIQISAYLGAETEYKYVGGVLIAKVPIKEAPVLTKWNDELLKLRNFLRTSTGLSLTSKRDREQMQKQTEDRDADLKRKQAREQEQRKQEEAKLQRNAEAERRQKKIEAAKVKLQAAVESYQKKAKEIWSRADNTPEGIEKKKKEADAALQELNRIQADFQKEVTEIN